MLVNAVQHPGAAIFQGIGMILVGIWAIWMGFQLGPNLSKPPMPKDDSEEAFSYVGGIVFAVLWLVFGVVAGMVWLK